VHPARLDPRRSAQVCGQCHSFWEFEDQAAERAANARGLPYRPGDDLRQTRFIVQPTVDAGSAIMQRFLQDDPGFIRDMFWSDGMVRATGREYNALLESPCFKNAKDDRHTLTCASCHTMHQTATIGGGRGVGGRSAGAIGTRRKRHVSAVSRAGSRP
jgi:hypothetical protein